MNRAKRIIQGLFLLLIAFELLNWLGVLHFHLDFSWLGLVGTFAGVFGFLLYFDPPAVVWGAALFGLTNDAVSDVFDLYNRFNTWDRYVHFTGGLCAGLIAYFILRGLEKRGSLSFRGAMIAPITIAVVSFAGFCYEYWEFLVDVVYFHHPKELGDAIDTVDDMLLNILGAVTFLLLLFLWRAIRKARQERAENAVNEGAVSGIISAMEDKKLWFRAKRYGYGWTPVTWQGWLSIAVYLGVLFISVNTLLVTPTGFHIGLHLAIVVLSTVLLIGLCVKKGEKAGWRWGGEDKK